ncbi:DNA primase [Nitrosospira briensis]|uniref:DNA primase n=1 Tax=Nitrosospira briensis TaxID=35799 RepID=UPI0008DF9BFD|nr:DNA primase [Nitrosospira briensis]SFO12260.1 hypothetical protein SAMN05216332_105157 [Nitrosospira briensis]
MSIHHLLSLLNKVKRTGSGRWVAACPAHDDRNPSLALRELDDGRVLLHCFAGCAAHEIVSSVGLQLTDLFPTGEIKDGKGKPERRPFPAADILRCIAFEALVVAVVATTRLAGPLSDTDHNRLMLAVTRIHEALAAGGISDAK